MSRIDLGPFKLEAPQKAANELPNEFSQNAVNSRVLSGNLEPWKQDTAQAQLVTKAGTIRSIHLMDIDADATPTPGPFLLHWTQDVQVAKGPIGGDLTERTYFTTADGVTPPRVTNIALATSETTPPAKMDATGYPYRWETLGVPSPSDAPIARVDAPGEIEEGEIALTNPGAESTTTGWTFAATDLQSTTTDFHTGAASFSSNNAAGAEAYQEVDIVTADIAIGQRVQVKAWLKGGSATDRARVRLEAWGAGPSAIETSTTPWSDLATAWTQVSAEILAVPEDTAVLRIYMEFEGAVDTAFIDDIELFVLQSQFVDKGEDLDDWITTSGSGGTVSAGIATAGHDATIQFSSSGSKTAVIHRNFNSKESPSYRIEFEYRATENVYLAVCLDCDAAGVGSQIRFAGKSVYLDQTGGWGSTFSSETKLADTIDHPFVGQQEFTASPEWWRGTISVVTGAGGKKRVTITAKSSDIALPYVTNVSAEFTPTGDYIGFKAWDKGSTHNGHLDNITIAVDPASTAGGSGDSDETLTDYVYTLANSTTGTLSMSGVSPASNEVQIGAAPSVYVSWTVTTPPAGYNADIKYLWRRVTGSDGTTTRRMVLPTAYPNGQIPIAEDEIHDTNTDSQLGDEIPENLEFFEAPPVDSHSIVAAANGITYLASKNQVFPSPVNQPHAYPPLWAKATDYKIVGLAALAADVYVLTQAFPYVITGSNPSALDMEKLAKPIGCRSRRSIAVDRRLGVVYTAADGLAYANKADVGLLTEGWVTEKEWAAFFPDQVTGVIYDNNYIGFNNTFGFWIDLSGKTGIGRLDFVATALFLNPLTGNLHMIVGGTHVTFNSAAGLRIYQWYSKDFLVGRPTSFQHARVLSIPGAGSTTLQLWYDGVLVHTQTISDSAEFILPDSKAEHWVQIRLVNGQRSIKRVLIAETPEELKG